MLLRSILHSTVLNIHVHITFVRLHFSRFAEFRFASLMVSDVPSNDDKGLK